MRDKNARATAKRMACLLQDVGMKNCVEVFKLLLAKLDEADACFVAAILPAWEVALAEYWKAVTAKPPEGIKRCGNCHHATRRRKSDRRKAPIVEASFRCVRPGFPKELMDYNHKCDGWVSHGIGEQGLHGKYRIEHMDGRPLSSGFCFVLRPDRDAAAWEALRVYAEMTENVRLRNDLERWLSENPQT